MRVWLGVWWGSERRKLESLGVCCWETRTAGVGRGGVARSRWTELEVVEVVEFVGVVVVCPHTPQPITFELLLDQPLATQARAAAVEVRVEREMYLPDRGHPRALLASISSTHPGEGRVVGTGERPSWSLHF